MGAEPPPGLLLLVADPKASPMQNVQTRVPFSLSKLFSQPHAHFLPQGKTKTYQTFGLEGAPARAGCALSPHPAAHRGGRHIPIPAAALTGTGVLSGKHGAGEVPKAWRLFHSPRTAVPPRSSSLLLGHPLLLSQVPWELKVIEK